MNNTYVARAFRNYLLMYGITTFNESGEQRSFIEIREEYEGLDNGIRRIDFPKEYWQLLN